MKEQVLTYKLIEYACASVFKILWACRIGVYGTDSYATGVREYLLQFFRIVYIPRKYSVLN